MALQSAAHTLPMEIKIYGDEETEHHGKWRTYRDSNARLDKHRGQVFSIIMGQCMQQVLDKMKQDTSWKTVSMSYDPLALLDFIEKTVMSQYQDTYPCATVYESQLSIMGYHQNTQSNDAYYNRFNTKCDFADAIGLNLGYHSMLHEWFTQLYHFGDDFEYLTGVQQLAVRNNSKDKYLAYVMIQKSVPRY